MPIWIEPKFTTKKEIDYGKVGGKKKGINDKGKGKVASCQFVNYKLHNYRLDSDGENDPHPSPSLGGVGHLGC